MTAGISLGDAAAAVGIVAGVVGIVGGAAKLFHYVARRRRHNQPSPERRRELGEECAVALVKVKSSIDTGWLGVLQWGQGWAEQERLRQNHDRLRAEGLNLLEELSRVRVVFGPSSRAADTFGDAVNAAEEVYNALQRIGREREDRPDDEYAARQVQAYFEEDRAKVEQARDHFAKAQARFEEAAS